MIDPFLPFVNFNGEIFVAIVYHFNVGITKDLQEVAEEKGLSIRPFNVIYKLVDDVKKEINTRLPSVDAEETIGMGEETYGRRNESLS